MQTSHDFYLPILGENYKISTVSEDRFPKHLTGACDITTKEIVVVNLQPEYIINKNLRHEIVHAMLEESGLGAECDFANEELVDWIAKQAPKMFRIFCQAKAFSKQEMQSFSNAFVAENKIVR